MPVTSEGIRAMTPWRWVFLVCLAVVFLLALSPTGGGADWFPQADKLRHACAFIVLWMLGRQAWVRPGWRLAALLLGFGVAIELAQSMTSYRDASFGDVGADMAGILAGWLLMPAAQPATPPDTTP